MFYVTERAVFQLTEDGPMLIEIARGADLERDILANMEFRPLIAEHIKETPIHHIQRGSIWFKEYHKRMTGAGYGTYETSSCGNSHEFPGKSRPVYEKIWSGNRLYGICGVLQIQLPFYKA